MQSNRRRVRVRRVVTDEVLEALREACARGETVKSVAQKLNLAAPTLQYWVHQLGLRFSHRSGMKGKHHSPEARKKMSESQRGKHSGPRCGPHSYEKTLRLEEAIINDYMYDKEQTWGQLARKHKVTETKARDIIGHHLMRACRADEECPFKPLLPEYKLEEAVRRNAVKQEVEKP